MGFNYSDLLNEFQKIRKSDNFIPITSAIFATAITMYGIKMIFRGRNGRKINSKKYRMIPTPPGSLIYFGKS